MINLLKSTVGIAILALWLNLGLTLLGMLNHESVLSEYAGCFILVLITMVVTTAHESQDTNPENNNT